MDALNNKFDFFRGSEAEQFNFYRIPKMLFTDKRFSKVSVEAKVLYGLLLDRMALSVKNGWVDEENRVYIYFKLEDAMEFMNVGKDKGVKLFAELDSDKGCGLIQKKKQGLGKPTIIYVMNFNSPNAEVKTSEKPKSALLKNRSQDFGKSDSNNTNINNTELSDTYPIQSEGLSEREQYKKLICNNIEYDCLIERYGEESIDSIVELMLDLVCCKREYVVVSSSEFPHEVVKNRMLKLKLVHIEYVLECMNNTSSKIKNIKAYLTSALYNAPLTIEHYYTTEVSYNMRN